MGGGFCIKWSARPAEDESEPVGVAMGTRGLRFVCRALEASANEIKEARRKRAFSRRLEISS